MAVREARQLIHSVEQLAERQFEGKGRKRAGEKRTYSRQVPRADRAREKSRIANRNRRASLQGTRSRASPWQRITVNLIIRVTDAYRKYQAIGRADTLIRLIKALALV